MPSSDLLTIYHELLQAYGPQGWWPLLLHEGSNPTKSGSHTGYHCGDYSYPRNRDEQFEIAVGAILTQNTAWTNVEMALNNLHAANLLHSPENMLNAPMEQLKEHIRPAGYFNQKAEYLRNIAEFFRNPQEFTRKTLLALKGVGEETADAILLYACNTPTFVIDAYTRRFLTYRDFISGDESYQTLQQLFHEALPRDTVIYQEFHALLVEHGKRYFSKKPFGDSLFTTETIS